MQVFDGVPPPYDKTKRMIIPEALRITRLRPGRKYTNLGRMCHEVGWKHWDTVKTLEKKRITKAEGYWAKKKEIITVRFPFLAPSRVFSVFAHLYMLLPTPCVSGRQMTRVFFSRRQGERRWLRPPRTRRCRRSRRFWIWSRTLPLSSRFATNERDFLGTF